MSNVLSDDTINVLKNFATIFWNAVLLPEGIIGPIAD